MALNRHKQHCERNLGQKTADVATRVGQGVMVAKGICATGKQIYGMAQAAAAYLSPRISIV